MILEAVVRFNEKQLGDIPFQVYRLKPIYKSQCDDTEKEWILTHTDIIQDGIVANYVYELYYKSFIEQTVVSKNKFYKLCKELLDMDLKVMRIGDYTANCFVKIK